MMMNFSDLARKDGAINFLGGFSPEETGGETVMMTLQFRQATNGVIVNTIVNGEPLITTSAGTFSQ